MKALRITLLVVTMSSLAFGWYVAKVQAGRAMVESANRFLASLSPELRAKAQFKFDDAERLNWHFIPRTRNGLPFKEMTEAQRELARTLLKAGVQASVYAKANTIMGLEPVLKEIEQGKGPVRDSELYFVSVFGEPSTTGVWGWRFEGHHIALNFTCVKGTMIATSPSFLGANPALVKQGPQKGTRALAREEDLGRALLQSLDEKQKTVALFENVALKDIVTMNSVKADPLNPKGVPSAGMTSIQRKKLEELLGEYLLRMPDDVAEEKRQKVKAAGLDKLYFGWAGGPAVGDPHYYRVQGPTFLIEYDNTQNDANHIHSVWRDFEGDFGRDLLREHYRATPHSN